MMRWLFILLCGLAVPVAAQEVQSPEDKNVDAIVREGNILALQLYAILKEGKDNTVVSPFAVSASMGLPFAGSEGSTESQMARIMRYRMAKGPVNAAFKTLNERLSLDSPYNLYLGLWLQKGEVNAAFKDVVEKGYRATLRTADFITRPDRVRSEVNGWLRDKSQGKLGDVIPLNGFTNRTRMVVLSGATVKGRWEQPFDLRNSKQAPFFLDRYVTSTVPTMFGAGDYNYLDEKKFALLELPYESKKGAAASLALLLFLPHDTYGLKGVEADLAADNLKGWLTGMRKRRVAVSIPRMKVTDTFSMVPTFTRMALTDPFGDGADFTGIREVGDLKISDVYHQASYSFDEGGSESSVAFGSTSLSSSDEAPVGFYANHPFLFMVIDKVSGSILIIGRVAAP